MAVNNMIETVHEMETITGLKCNMSKQYTIARTM